MTDYFILKFQAEDKGPSELLTLELDCQNFVYSLRESGRI